MAARRDGAGQRTGTRILDAALELFNRDGAGRVTTNHIAAHLGISPGNLYYWYPDKRAIVRALWARHVAQHAALWEAADLPTPDEMLRRLAATGDLQRAHLVLSRDLPALAHEDPELRSAVTAERSRRITLLGALARTWRADGLLRPVDDERLDALVEAVLLVTETWVPVTLGAAASDGAEGVPASADQAHGERLLRAVLEPYLEPAPDAPSPAAPPSGRSPSSASPAHTGP